MAFARKRYSDGAIQPSAEPVDFSLNIFPALLKQDTGRDEALNQHWLSDDVFYDHLFYIFF
ncbi:hypothetical protein BN129_1320 [Cronobacter sakazakii 701]|nr:hypothetical protein BN129_1320 [Cronobacter sakazakii 701]